MRLTNRLCVLAMLAGLAAKPAYAQFDAPACPAAKIQFAPIVATHKIPPYPPLSQRLGEQGTTILQVTIDPHTGLVSDVAVDRSSGSLRLDDAAATFVKQTWQWTVSRYDCPSGSIVTRVSIVWDLKEPALAWGTPLVMEDKDFPAGARDKKEQGTSVVLVLVTENGTVAQAQITNSSGYPDLDAKALEIAKARSWRPGQIDGHGAKSVMFVFVQWPAPK